MNDLYPRLPFCRVSVKALIFDQQGKILLAQEEDGIWELLGGGIESNDLLAELDRETNEEAGLKFHPKPTVKHRVTLSDHPHKPVKILNVCIECHAPSALNFKPSDECVVLKYFDPQEILELHENDRAKIFSNNVVALATQLLTEE